MRKLRPEAGFSQLLQKIAPSGLSFRTPKKEPFAGKLFHAESLKGLCFFVSGGEHSFQWFGQFLKIEIYVKTNLLKLKDFIFSIQDYRI
ncbi:hypothetical protein DENIS_3027 [Desulfonema ishimotonii]|uniref:Uncharacterized protein n=1 Tax=Desulfonema ishimotonii TaxID=45657 RepID=A0A401FYN1_9BACT|nr:hypothetical protein [Desulfonema ishimotonii]GBC62064.1 hypothetical protein DENIS_3027 [Desulfonema ishimotonii]